jgi:hypothetical protein
VNTKRRIALDRYAYEDIYPAFKAATDEKEKTARINQRFLNYLARKNLVLAGNEPILTADIGCGPCDTLIKYLSGVRCETEFDVRATDYLSEYADPEGGTARHNLVAAQANGTLRLARFSVKVGNAFTGNLLGLLSPSEDGGNSAHAFRLVFASHLMYHAAGIEDVRRLISDVAANLLDRNGIAILYHIANRARTFQEFRAGFGSQSDGPSNSNTGAVTIDDPPAQIIAACRELRLPLFELEFVSYLRFGSLNDGDWRTFADPLSYDLLAERNPDAYEDLKRLYFIVQRAPLEFANDNSATGLSNFIVQIRQAIEENRDVLPLAECMQVFIRKDTPDTLSLAIPEALGTASASLTD